LRIFHNTTVQDDLLPVISKYVCQKREANANTLYAFLYRQIKTIIQREDNYEIESKSIWETLTDPEILPGAFIPNKPLSYDSTDFGPISQKQVIEMCKDVFGAVKAKHHGSSRRLLFDKRKLDRLANIYELDLEIKVKENGTDGHVGTDVGLDRHLVQEVQSIKSEHNLPADTGIEQAKNDPSDHGNVSQAS
jgi:hypothetical protein